MATVYLSLINKLFILYRSTLQLLSTVKQAVVFIARTTTLGLLSAQGYRQQQSILVVRSLQETTVDYAQQ